MDIWLSQLMSHYGLFGLLTTRGKIFVKQDFWIDITGLFQKQDLSQEIDYIYIATGYHGDDIIGNTKAQLAWIKLSKDFTKWIQLSI